ncbi:MAG: glycosyltransferase family 2 protein [Planctomycetes bacterium]|nr:glycosyltransferase family 2 protein [Planctomycetota bacterium]
MSRASVTFAIPCRNAGPYLEPLLSSLLRQTRQDFDVVLVDDASTDDSVVKARAVCGPRLRVVENPVPLGLGGNWNRAAELVETPFFCLAHVDDVYQDAFLEGMLRALEAAPTAAFAHCRAHALDESGRVIDSPVERFKDGFWSECLDPDPRVQFLLLRRGNFVMCPSAVYRTDRFRAVGPFDPKLRATLDWERNVRTALAGHTIAAVPDALLGYRRHLQSVTAANVRTLERYREEAALLSWMDTEGRARGWLAADAPPSRALRNNLLYDVFVDLRGRQYESAALRLAFARDEHPELAWDGVARIVAAAARAGLPGRLALAGALRLVVWRAELAYFMGSRLRSSTTSRRKRA